MSFFIQGAGCPTPDRQITMYFDGNAILGTFYCSSSHTFMGSISPNSNGTLDCFDGMGHTYELTLTTGNHVIQGQYVDASWVSPSANYDIN
jgi:hypothetical protein